MIRLLVLVGVLGACAPGSSGDGSFRERRVRVGSAPVSVLIVDFDVDGDPDVLAAGQMGVALVVNDGRGGLRLRRTVQAGPAPQGLTAADFDEDGWPDVAVANHETDHVTVLFGGPDGYSAVRQRRITVASDPHPHEVRALDADGDGHADLLVDDRSAGAYRLFLGRGDGRFSAAGAVKVGGDPYLRSAVADVDGDGRPDLVTPTPRGAALLFGDGRGGFAVGPLLEAPGFRPFSVAVGDVTGDGVPDVAAGDAREGEGDGRLVIWHGVGIGRRAAGVDVHAVARGPAEVAVADVDGDGVDDVAVTSYGGGEVAILRGGDAAASPIRLEVRGNPWGVAAGDLDGDGRAEVVTADNGGDEISIFHATGGG